MNCVAILGAAYLGGILASLPGLLASGRLPLRRGLYLSAGWPWFAFNTAVRVALGHIHDGDGDSY